MENKFYLFLFIASQIYLYLVFLFVDWKVIYFLAGVNWIGGIACLMIFLIELKGGKKLKNGN